MFKNYSRVPQGCSASLKRAQDVSIFFRMPHGQQLSKRVMCLHKVRKLSLGIAVADVLSLGLRSSISPRSCYHSFNMCQLTVCPTLSSLFSLIKKKNAVQPAVSFVSLRPLGNTVNTTIRHNFWADFVEI